MKNLIIQYEGGGYDGCIWGYNYCMFDAAGELHDIYSSGVMACKTKAQVIYYLQNAVRKNESYSVIDLSLQASWDKFVKDAAPSEIIIVAEYLQAGEFKLNIEIYIPCAECGEYLYINELTPVGQVHQGGLVYTPARLLCSCCLADGECQECHEYVGPGNLHAGLCDSCKDDYTCKCCGEVNTKVFAGKCPSCWDDPEHTPQTIETITTILDRVPGIHYVQTHNHRVKFGPDIKHLNNVITTAQFHRGVDTFHLINTNNLTKPAGDLTSVYNSTAGQISDIILQLLNK